MDLNHDISIPIVKGLEEEIVEVFTDEHHGTCRRTKPVKDKIVEIFLPMLPELREKHNPISNFYTKIQELIHSIKDLEKAKESFDKYLIENRDKRRIRPNYHIRNAIENFVNRAKPASDQIHALYSKSGYLLKEDFINLFDIRNQLVSIGEKSDGLEIERGKIRILTKPISLADTKDVVHELGRYYISFPISNPRDIKIWSENNKYKSQDGHPHPHVKDNRPCLGNAEIYVKRRAREFDLFGVFEAVTTFLQTYNKDGAYFRLEKWKFTEEMKCSDCGELTDQIERCPVCGDLFCQECITQCRTCDHTICPNCITSCSICAEDLCEGCISTCNCGQSAHGSCLETCPTCGSYYCKLCAPEQNSCSDCGKQACPSCIENLKECPGCGEKFCRECLVISKDKDGQKETVCFNCFEEKEKGKE
jgi:hypothetical protein